MRGVIRKDYSVMAGCGYERGSIDWVLAQIRYLLETSGSWEYAPYEHVATIAEVDSEVFERRSGFWTIMLHISPTPQTLEKNLGVTMPNPH